MLFTPGDIMCIPLICDKKGYNLCLFISVEFLLPWKRETYAVIANLPRNMI